MGAFSAKFSTTPIVAKLYQKVWGWNDGMDHLYHHAKFGGNQTTHAGMRGWSVMFFTFFVNNARTLNSHKWRSCVIQEEIMSVFALFVGQFRWGLQCFFRRRKALSSGWNRFENCRYVALRLVRQCAGKFSKSEKTGAKFVRTTSII